MTNKHLLFCSIKVHVILNSSVDEVNKLQVDVITNKYIHTFNTLAKDVADFHLSYYQT